MPRRSSNASADPPDDGTEEATYVSTPQGIFTASGIWFGATEESLRAYAGPVLEHVPLGALIRRAERWVRSPQVFTLWLLPLALLMLPWWAAAAVALAFYAAWACLSPSLASRWAAAVAGWLNTAVVQGLFYVFVLSILAAQDRFAAVGVGLAGFVLLRWGLVERALRPLVRPVRRVLYDLPAADQTLRAFIIRAALARDLPLPELERMKRRLFEAWTRSGPS